MASFQNTRFVLAEVKTEIEINRAFYEMRQRLRRGQTEPRGGGDAQIRQHRDAVQDHRPVPAALRRLRLHGGVPDLRFYTDARIQRIYGGSSDHAGVGGPLHPRTLWFCHRRPSRSARVAHQANTVSRKNPA